MKKAILTCFAAWVLLTIIPFNIVAQKHVEPIAVL